MSLTAAHSIENTLTTGVLAAEEDEVSAAIVDLFSEHAQNHQAISTEAATLKAAGPSASPVHDVIGAANNSWGGGAFIASLLTLQTAVHEVLLIQATGFADESKTTIVGVATHVEHGAI